MESDLNAQLFRLNISRLMCWWWVGGGGGCQTSRGLTVTDIQVEGTASSTLNSKQMWEAACFSWLMSSSTLLLRTSNRGLMHIISRHSPPGVKKKKNFREATSWMEQSFLWGYRLRLSVVLCLWWPSEKSPFFSRLNGMACGCSPMGIPAKVRMGGSFDKYSRGI